jgi:hypothetical protein
MHASPARCPLYKRLGWTSNNRFGAWRDTDGSLTTLAGALSVGLCLRPASPRRSNVSTTPQFRDSHGEWSEPTARHDGQANRAEPKLAATGARTDRAERVLDGTDR